MLRCSAVICGLLLGQGSASAQAPTTVDLIDRFVQAEMDRQRIPGLSVAVLRGDSILLLRGYGVANLKLDLPATERTMYEAGSITKQFTAAAIVRLAEQGRLSLDDPIIRYLPEGDPIWRQVTIRQLLTHTSGIPDFADTMLDTRRDYAEGELARLAATQPLLFSPGERWSYSNSGYVLLGIIIHRVAGEHYGEYLKRSFFQPASMSTARVIPASDAVPDRAAGYELVADTLASPDWVAPSLMATADGGLMLSARDLALWAIALNHGDVPSRKALDEAWSPVHLNNGGTYPYGFGWDVTQQRGYRRIGHSGASQGFQTTIQRYPDFDLTIVVLANLAQANPPAIAFAIAGIVEPQLTPPHRLASAVSSKEPPTPIDQLAREAAKRSSEFTPGYKAFLSDGAREGLSRRVNSVGAWRSLGCENVTGRSISRLGAHVAWICYAQGTGSTMNRIALALYDSTWHTAGIDLYPY